MLLCDSAQVAENKLYVLGGGWSITGPTPPIMGVAILVKVDWNQANRVHKWKLVLETEDGESVKLPTQMGEQEVTIEGDLEVGRPPGLPAGIPLDAVLAMNFGGIPLPPGKGYVWKFFLDGNHEDDWQLPFTMRGAQPAGPQIGMPPPSQP